MPCHLQHFSSAMVQKVINMLNQCYLVNIAYKYFFSVKHT